MKQAWKRATMPTTLKSLLIVLSLTAWSSSAMADDGSTIEKASGAGAGVVSALAAGEALRRRRKAQKVDRIVKDDAIRHGWDTDRVRREAVATKRALAMKARR